MEASVISHSGFQQGMSGKGPLLRLRTDEQLLKLFRQGNEEAFEVIFDRYRPRLLAYLKRMLGKSGIDAEDVLQDVFCKAYDSLRADRRDIAVKPWLYRVAHNRSIDHLRRPQFDPEQVLASTRGLDLDPATHAEQREELRGLVASIGALPAQQRSALLLREMEGLSHKQLAATLDTSVPAIKSLLVRARVGLAKERAVAALHGGPAPISALAKLLGLGGAGGAATGVAGGGACAATAGGCTAITAYGIKAVALVAATAVVGGGATVTAKKVSAPKTEAAVATTVEKRTHASRVAAVPVTPTKTRAALPDKPRRSAASLQAATPEHYSTNDSGTYEASGHGGAAAPDDLSDSGHPPVVTTTTTTATTTTTTTPTTTTTVETTPTPIQAKSATER